jgi:hypothetical protein
MEDLILSESHWNYRVVWKDGVYGIHEAYYSSNGKVVAVTVDPVSPVATSEDEELGENPVEVLDKSLRWMLLALDDPILDYESIPEDGAKWDDEDE